MHTVSQIDVLSCPFLYSFCFLGLFTSIVFHSLDRTFPALTFGFSVTNGTWSIRHKPETLIAVSRGPHWDTE